MTTYAEECTRVYTWTGRAAHLMPLYEYSIPLGRALCPVLPSWPDEWRGTGSQEEYDLAASLPLCKRCGLAAADEDSRRARRLTEATP